MTNARRQARFFAANGPGAAGARPSAMTATPLIILFTAQILLGLALLALYFRGARKPVLSAIHLLLGAAGLEGMLYLIQTGPGPSSYGIVAAALIALALLSGLTAPMLGRRSPSRDFALAAHIGLAAAGFILFLSWANA